MMKKSITSKRRFLRIREQQLPLPLFTTSVTFLFDECWAPAELIVSLGRTGINATSVPNLGLRSSADDAISATAENINAVVITTDYRDYIKKTMFAGKLPPDVIWVDQSIPSRIASFAQFLELIANLGRSTPDRRWFAYYSSNTGEYKIVEKEMYPSDLQAILADLSEARTRGGLSTKDLQRLWSCNESRALRRAKELVKEGWLHPVKTKKGYRYLPGQRLFNLWRLPRKLKKEVRRRPEKEDLRA
ncbi:DUF5615 family PIN-like protein [Candidatus Bipolaricaulota bacterium]|nr:DUF5615 family PIN-like protein [Candidatus Bipolaricaulota bacterium]